jgi:hypothetical protein
MPLVRDAFGSFNTKSKDDCRAAKHQVIFDMDKSFVILGVFVLTPIVLVC